MCLILSLKDVLDALCFTPKTRKIMSAESVKSILENVLENMPNDWLRLTTHRLDIYNEKLAKTDFITQFDKTLSRDLSNLANDLKNLPTAFDYIRLGHPLSCVLEWAIAKENDVHVNNVISFSSQTMPILAILRKNHFDGKKTLIVNNTSLPKAFNTELLKTVYGYNFELVESGGQDSFFSGSKILLTDFDNAWKDNSQNDFDFTISLHEQLGSVVVTKDESYIGEIQHVRRRESIAMTPHDCFKVLGEYIKGKRIEPENPSKTNLEKTINEITNTNGAVSIGSCGLSVQYAIMMGLVNHALDKHPGKDIKFIVPPNCYGGTNDQARRVAACIDNVEIVDLAVDSGSDMVDGIESILTDLASKDAVPYIIAEIPTNPRVEVPDLERLKDALAKKRKTADGKDAIESVFILDQTFCPNVKFLGEDDFLGSSKTIAYVSGSKFPSGGLSTAGYAVANNKAQDLMGYVQKHLELCDNEATPFQIETLTKQMPSMNERISGAYKNTREFVDFISKTLPSSKINFVPEELAEHGFTPSVFSLDLPTKGDTHEQREGYKRNLNQKLINLMINEIPEGTKHCVSYGQLEGSYWTIPATSTQGTTKEGDKDYIVRVSMSPKVDLEKHKEVFKTFCELYI